MEKILIIEDEKNIRETLKDILELKGYEVVMASEGEEGIVQAKTHNPDLIICDVMMPGISGWSVIEKIRHSEKALANTPFLFLTAKVDQSDFRIGMNLGADDYLTKPVSNDDLFKAIQTRLKRRKSHREEIQQKVQEIQTQINYISPHEYNTPLNGIVGGIEVLDMILQYSDEFSREEMEKMLGIMRISVNRLRNTLNNNILFNIINNLEAEPYQKKRLTTGLSPEAGKLIRKIAETLAKEYDRSEDLQLSVEDVTLEISLQNLEKVIDELVDNAFKFSKSGTGVYVEGKCGEDSYEISITEAGRGMSPEEIAEIGPFRQFERHLYEQQGMGMGLFLAKSLVKLNQGKFNIQSVKTEGTKVHISIPINVDEKQLETITH